MAAQAFLETMAATIGADKVLGADRASERYGASTMGVQRVIAGAVRPASSDEVRSVVLVAVQTGVPLYPVSTGNNWGYGSANPVMDGCVVVDLSGMRQIVDFDPETGLVTLEPGVTQRMLRAYLDERGLAFLCPVSGAGPDCSLIGNALERGYGITPHADHFLSIMSLEAVLADGRLYRPPLAELGCSDVDRAFKWGVGPFLDGMFSQGSFGIVTRMTIALAPIPERVEALFFGVPEDAMLEDAVHAVRAVLREVGGVTGSVNLMNMHRVLSMMEPYPRDRLDANGLIEASCLQQMARRNQVMPWMGAGALYGNAKVVRAAKSVIRQRLRGVSKRLVFFTPSSVSWLNRLSAHLPGAPGRSARKIFGTLDKTLTLLAGEPSEIALPLAYWLSGRMPEAGQPMNPARDGCGLLWYSPLVPMKPQVVRTYVEMVRRICIEHRIEPLITLTSVSDRCFDSTVPILFDRADPQAVERAGQCYRALLAAGRDVGCVPYRAPVDAMRFFMPDNTPYWEIVSGLKHLLDPSGILSPGRYVRT